MKNVETWRLLNVEYEDPYLNLALEEAVPFNVGNGASPNTIRFWRNRNAAVMGNFQSAEMEINLDACRKHQTAVARRFTGGGAVYHDLGNLNCAISLRKDHPMINKPALGDAFSRMSQGLIEGLRRLGAPAEFEPPNSLEVNGRKIVGGAGAMKSGFVFHHFSILVSTDLEVLSEVLSPNGNSANKPGVRSVRKDVSTLSNELGRELTIAEVEDSLKRGFEKSFTIEFAEGETTEEERALAEKLYREKYSTETWNLKR